MKKCLFLVEGPFDKQRLSVLEDLFDENKLIIIPFETDKLQMKDYHKKYQSEIQALLNKELTYEFSDFDMIVQVCDTDGCYISNDKIIEDTTLKHTKYEALNIKVPNLSSFISIHNYKKENIDNLLVSNNIHLYYNSTNIDHVFDNKQNPSLKEKRNLAVKMSNNYNRPNELITLLFNLNLSNTTDYFKSWDFIKKNENSLKRATNIIIFLLDNYDDLKDDIKMIIDEERKTKNRE